MRVNWFLLKLIIFSLAAVGCTDTSNNGANDTSNNASFGRAHAQEANSAYQQSLIFDGYNWSFPKTTYSENYIHPSQTERGGTFYSFAVPSNDRVSKASLNFTDFVLTFGDLVELSFCLNAPPRSDLSDVFIADLECVFCWPENTDEPNPSPGIRIHLKDKQGYPVIERAKIGLGRDSIRPDPSFRHGIPRGRWVPITWRILLGDTAQSGWSELIVDGQTIIRENALTLVRRTAFADEGINLISQHYDSLEMGVTANGSGKPLKLGIKNVLFRTIRHPNEARIPQTCDAP